MVVVVVVVVLVVRSYHQKHLRHNKVALPQDAAEASLQLGRRHPDLQEGGAAGFPQGGDGNVIVGLWETHGR